MKNNNLIAPVHILKCIRCKIRKNELIPICYSGTHYYSDDEDLSGQYICNYCLEQESESIEPDYGICKLCYESVAYHTCDLKSNGFNHYCNEHIGETDMDEEEIKGVQDFQDYVNN